MAYSLHRFNKYMTPPRLSLQVSDRNIAAISVLEMPTYQLLVLIELKKTCHRRHVNYFHPKTPSL